MMKSSLYKGFQWVYEGHIECLNSFIGVWVELQAAQVFQGLGSLV